MNMLRSRRFGPFGSVMAAGWFPISRRGFAGRSRHHHQGQPQLAASGPGQILVGPMGVGHWQHGQRRMVGYCRGVHNGGASRSNRGIKATNLLEHHSSLQQSLTTHSEAQTRALPPFSQIPLSGTRVGYVLSLPKECSRFLTPAFDVESYAVPAHRSVHASPSARS